MKFQHRKLIRGPIRGLIPVLIRGLILVLILVLFPTAPLLAAEITVTPAGDGSAATIAAAIAAAAPGDTISLSDGCYRGDGNRNLLLPPFSLLLRSTSGDPALCEIDCEFSGRALEITARAGIDLQITGISFSNGSAENGGAVTTTDGAPLFSNCVFFNNQARYFGGAIYCDSGAPRLIQCRFDGNIVDHGAGGAVWLKNSNAEFHNCLWRDNSVNRGTGGALWCGRSRISIQNCRFSGNSVATGSGGAIASASSQPDLSDCLLLENAASIAGGAIEISSGDGRLIRCTFLRNGADRGGAVAVKNGTPFIQNCTFVQNSAFETGSAISATLSAEIEASLSIFTGGDCPPISCSDTASQCRLTGCILFSNRGDEWSGCIAAQDGINANLSVDPLFCPDQQDSFYLRPASAGAGPHLLDNGQLIGGGAAMGSWPVGCDRTGDSD